MKRIKASEGMYLTQRSVNNEGARVFAISLYLADNDSEENWREASQEEYYKWQQEQEAATEVASDGVGNAAAQGANVKEGGDD